ncbi:NAD+ synthase (glutamine-hydrolysing) [Curtobacterium sp. PhB130]|uniref:NAD+ synthase n=1 Tax=Curtobacterium sp. PhB130 TaxID=2485178 RepID=UPI000F4BD3AA|nr:NAD+ synthase [Curtobacterium sp. PhB130]ROS74009.1 NAD+ synthase (glutamine-hydrolysing) [Curtobacterium sp. PhB130]
MPRLRLALAQTNPVVGAFDRNAAGILDAVRSAAAHGADLVAVGEMAISGYPIEDLASRPSFLRAARAAVSSLAVQLADEGLGDVPVVVGHPDGPFEPRAVDVSTAPTAIAKNCASILQHGRVVATTAKYHLPNYSVFDEYRVFIPGSDLLVARIADVDVAIIICEDLWRDGGPVARVLDADAGLLLVVNASPWVADKDEVRLPLVTRRATESDTIVAYVNIVGGQDDLVFDGDSVVVDEQGTILARAPQFRTHLLLVDVDPAPARSEALVTEHVQRVALDTPNSTPGSLAERPALPRDVAVLPSDLAAIWDALVLGTRDYVQKNGFRSVVLGLSGGIDSAVCAAIAVDALGPSQVVGVSMPSRWSSSHSMSDADDVAARLGLQYRTEPIADLVAPFDAQLALTGLAAENIQARVRALILMGLSNLDGHLVLTTGNKTELAVGYSTNYGDSVGGFAPIKDVPKTTVWELARWRNALAVARGETEPIPENSIAKPPSAELREGQEDQDTLPPYEVLDAILDRYVTQAQGAADIVAAGFDADTVAEVTRLVDRSEWKRRQGAIGPKISGMAFGRDRRLPITYRPSGPGTA